MLQMEENTRPPFSCADARRIAASHYGLRVDAAEPLPSELDRNFHLRASDDRPYLLKIAHSSISDSVIDLQNKTLRHLGAALECIPRLIPARSGDETIRAAAADGRVYRARLLNYIEGVPLRDFRPHADDLLADIGSQLGRLSAALQTFQHSEKRLDYRWHIGNLPAVAAHARDLPPAKKALLDHFLRLIERELQPALPSLRHSFTYNDPNDSNILVRAQGAETPRVVGLIDFGDMVYGPAVADLAVALAYVMMGSARPLEKAVPVVAAYHRVFPLDEKEMRLLYPMIAARLCLSVCISWHQQRREADNRHLSISEADAWNLLERLRALHPRYAHYLFRDACDRPPLPQNAAVVDWLRQQKPAPILGYALDAHNSRAVDLGLSSAFLAEVSDLADPATYEMPLRRLLGADVVGIGYYDEVRPIYLADMYALDHQRRRAVHIGADIFAPAGTPVYAPLAGTVHSLRDHDAEQDAGPTLILRHDPPDAPPFFTIYGHLSPPTLDRWRAGQSVDAGELLAHIGDYPRNGNWVPHLHFQIALDLLDQDNFPGVCAPDLRRLHRSLSPDPNFILRLPYSLSAPMPTPAADLLRRRRAALNPALSLHYQRPLRIERGDKRHLIDEAGQRYLDCVNNVAHLGHNHPRILAAARKQLATLNTNTRYLHETIVEYAEALAATLPDPLSVCFFVNSGSEANELALRLAMARTGGSDFIVMDHTYHGHTSSLIDLSPYKFNGRGGQGRPKHVEVAALPDGFRGEMRGFGAEAGEFYARSVAQCITSIRARGQQLAAFFAESLIGTGGQMPLPAGYLRRCYDMTRRAGGVCVADEVQTGFGRVGSHFWSFQRSGVVPDIVTMGKPIANGHPLSAVVTTPAIAAALNQGMEYFNTFGGNPVSCAIGLEALAIIADEQLQENARSVGDYWIGRLRDLARRYPIIGQARGAGLFLGLELIRDAATLAPAAWETAYIVERMKDCGILTGIEGPHHNVLKLKPPMIFSRADVDLFMAVFEEVLGDTVLQGTRGG